MRYPWALGVKANGKNLKNKKEMENISTDTFHRLPHHNSDRTSVCSGRADKILANKSESRFTSAVAHMVGRFVLIIS